MELNTILIILGILALIGLVAHGVWSNRREKSQYFNNSKNFTHQENDVSVTRNQINTERRSASQLEQPLKRPEQSFVSTDLNKPLSRSSHTPQTGNVESIRITLPTNSESTIQEIPAQSSFESGMNDDNTVIYQYEPEKKQPAANMAERTIGEVEHLSETEYGVHQNDELKVSLQGLNESPISKPKPIEPIHTVVEEPKVESKPATGYIMLYVVAAENALFYGKSLVKALDDLGFIFGRDNFYHHHLDLTLASPVIFSVANVNQPGTFNLYGMDDFSTNGIAIYMPLPSPGDARTNLKLMIKAAKNLAAQLNGFVLTEQEQIFNEEIEKEYLARI